MRVMLNMMSAISKGMRLLQMQAIRRTKSWSGVLVQTPGLPEDRIGEGLRRRSRR